MQNPKPKFTGNYFNCKKQGPQAHECWSNTSDAPTTPRFEGHCYICQKYGHRSQQCRSKEKSKWTSKRQTHAPKKDNSYNWDYNTWYSCHYYGEYSHITKNFIRTHLRGN